MGLLTISEAASKMSVSRQSIYSWIRKGKIQPVRTPGGRYRIPEEQLTVVSPMVDLSIYDKRVKELLEK